MGGRQKKVYLQRAAGWCFGRKPARLTRERFDRLDAEGRHRWEVDHTNGKGYLGHVLTRALEIVTRAENARRAAARLRAG